MTAITERPRYTTAALIESINRLMLVLEDMGGEVTPEWDAAYAETLERSDDKLGAIAHVLDALQVSNKHDVEMEQYWRSRRLRSETAIQDVKDKGLALMAAMGVTKHVTEVGPISVRKNGGVRPLDWVKPIPPTELPERFQRVTVESNNGAIREALEAGESLEFVRLGERGKHLRLR